MEVICIDSEYISELVKDHLDADYYYDEDEESLRLFDCTNPSHEDGKETSRILRNEDYEYISMPDVLEALIYENLIEPGTYLFKD